MKRRFWTGVIVGIAVLGCVACGNTESTETAKEEATDTESETTAEVTEWTLDGNFIDDSDNHLMIVHMTTDAGYDSEGWSVTVISSAGEMVGGECQDKGGTLEGSFVSLDDEGNVSEETAVTLTQEGDGIYLKMEDGTEYHFIPDTTDYSEEASAETLPMFQYNEIYGDVYNSADAAAYDYIAFDKVTKEDVTHAIVPYVDIVAIDDSEEGESKLYGNYWYFEFEKQDDTLVAVSASHCPGYIIAERIGEDDNVIYTATGMEEALTDDDLESVFGEYYDKYMEAISNEDGVDAAIAKVISDYVNTNGIAVTKYQLAGEEAKELS